jgi:DNA polymerase-3 subunit beta
MTTNTSKKENSRKKEMKLSIPKAELQRGLARLQSIVEKRSTMPILANVLLEATTESGHDLLSLTATDLEVGIRSTHPTTIEHPGAITTSAKKIYEIVRELPDESIQIEVSPNNFVQIRCARAIFNLAGAAPEEYPTPPKFSSDHMILIQPLILSEMIEKTMYAACTDETRYNLNGVYLEHLPDTEKLRMVATDGHRLAYVDRFLGTDLSSFPTGVIIPRKGLGELKRLVDEDDESDFKVAFDENSGVASKNNVTLFMRLIEGEFPKYQQVIPREISHQLIINRDEFIQAIRRVALLSAERSHAIRLDLIEGQLRLSSNNPDLGEASEDLDVDYAGAELSIAFNARYLIDALAVIHAKEIHLGFQDSLSPTRMVPTDDDDTLAVVMPMRI